MLFLNGFEYSKQLKFCKLTLIFKTLPGPKACVKRIAKYIFTRINKYSFSYSRFHFLQAIKQNSHKGFRLCIENIERWLLPLKRWSQEVRGVRVEEADWRESNSAQEYDTVIRRETNKQKRSTYNICNK